MKIFVGYYTEIEMEVSNEFLPLERKEYYDYKDQKLLQRLVKKVSSELPPSTELLSITDINDDVMFNQ